MISGKNYDDISVNNLRSSGNRFLEWGNLYFLLFFIIILFPVSFFLYLII